MACIFGARAIRRTFEDPLHDGGAAEGVKGVFTREQLLQRFSYVYEPTSTDGEMLPKPSLQMPTHPVRLLPRGGLRTFLVPSMVANLQFVPRSTY